jgi:hypothetical protein
MAKVNFDDALQQSNGFYTNNITTKLALKSSLLGSND